MKLRILRLASLVLLSFPVLADRIDGLRERGPEALCSVKASSVIAGAVARAKGTPLTFIHVKRGEKVPEAPGIYVVGLDDELTPQERAFALNTISEGWHLMNRHISRHPVSIQQEIVVALTRTYLKECVAMEKGRI